MGGVERGGSVYFLHRFFAALCPACVFFSCLQSILPELPFCKDIVLLLLPFACKETLFVKLSFEMLRLNGAYFFFSVSMYFKGIISWPFGSSILNDENFNKLMCKKDVFFKSPNLIKNVHYSGLSHHSINPFFFLSKV